MAYSILGLTKVGNDDPQKFCLTTKDQENTEKNYIWHTDFGTEVEIRSMLEKGGMSDVEIDALFQHAADHVTS